MDSETIDVVTGWGTVAVGDGYRGLHELADAEFTGAVTDGLGWAFVLNGRCLGVFEGSLEAFEGDDLTAYEAPDPGIVLLYAMQETGGETQASYYTKKMPLAEADETLRSGKFTGFVRLSENVLSGDYYVVYYGGKSMSVAFVGNSRRLLTGDEAFERANDEVGIYEVVDVDVAVVDLPDAPDPEPESESESESSAPAAATTDSTVERDDPTAAAVDDDEPAPADARGGETTSAEDDDPEPPSGDASTPEAEAEAETAAGTEAAGAEGDDDPAAVTFGSTADADAAGDLDETTDEADTDGANVPPDETANTGETGDDEMGDAVNASVTDDREGTPDATAETAAVAGEAGEADDAETDDGGRPGRTSTDEPAAGRASTREVATSGASAEALDDDVFSEEEEWREARAIPSLDPSQTDAADADAERRRHAPTEGGPKADSGNEGAAATTPEPDSPDESPAESPAAASSGESRLRERLADVEAARERLAAERDELTTERDEYRERVEELASRVDELEAEIETLQSRLAAADADGDADAADPSVPDRTMSATEAMTGTNLFVRYASKADPTLEDAHGGQARRDEVNDNLRLEHHTQFDTEGLRVDGKPYDQFLYDTTEYRFVEWVVRNLLYDVQATRAESELQTLYDAVPRIDRIELDGTVSVRVGEGEESQREELTFDVILWDGRGNPLLVADLNTTRDPATEGVVSSLIADAHAVGENYDSLGGALYVTASYFEPGALDAVGDATGSGFLSRGNRRSFVKLGRKQGFHLCLVEARNGEFHVNVPDL